MITSSPFTERRSLPIRSVAGAALPDLSWSHSLPPGQSLALPRCHPQGKQGQHSHHRPSPAASLSTARSPGQEPLLRLYSARHRAASGNTHCPRGQGPLAVSPLPPSPPAQRGLDTSFPFPTRIEYSDISVCAVEEPVPGLLGVPALKLQAPLCRDGQVTLGLSREQRHSNISSATLVHL